MNNQLETTRSSLESSQRDLTKKLQLLEERNQKLNKDYSSLTFIKQNLQSKYDTLTIQFEKLRESRFHEFQLIQNNIYNSLEKEFNSMKIQFTLDGSNSVSSPSSSSGNN
jgi:chromosome segregation ATPase